MEREYVIIKHPLRVKGNIFLLGTKFCNGVAVVVKNSKAYRNLLKCPLLKNHKELSMEWLPKLGFRSKDIKQVFGKEVATAFIAMQQNSQVIAHEGVKLTTSAKEEIIENFDNRVSKLREETVKALDQIEIKVIVDNSELPPLSLEDQANAHKEIKLCAAIKASKEVCKNRVSKKSTSGLYCSAHCSQE